MKGEIRVIECKITKFMPIGQVKDFLQFRKRQMLMDLANELEFDKEYTLRLSITDNDMHSTLEIKATEI